MNEKYLFEKLDANLLKLKSGSNESTKLVDECITTLKRLDSAPQYQLGEFQTIINEKINTLCRTTGQSYESVLIKIKMPKI